MNRWNQLNGLTAYFSRFQKWSLGIFVMVGLCHAIISNDRYIIAKTDEGIEFFSRKESVKWGFRGLIPYAYNTIDNANRSRSPFEQQDVKSLYFRHWLGTDSLGRDVLAGLVYGSFIALQVGLLSVLFSLLIGIILAYFSGYHGDSHLRIYKKHIPALLIISAVLLFYIVYSSMLVSVILLIALFAIWHLAIRMAPRVQSKTRGLAFDLIIFRVIDIINSIPGLFLILILLSLFREATVWNVIWVIVLLRWPVITRHLRAEILKIKEEDYIMAARSIGFPDWYIYWKHILPMAISPVLIVLAFGFGTAVLLESTLSFLGIGMSVDQVSWGAIIKQARLNFDLWWLAIFPGLAIYFVIMLFNSLGTTINRHIRGIEA